MGKLGTFIAGCVFLAAAFITLSADHNWQGALLLAAIGFGLIIYVLKLAD